MVILIFSITDQQDKVRHFRTRAELEVALELVSRLKAANERIQRAFILDNGQRIDLPLDTFDGQPFAAPIQQLQKEWEAILENPSPSPEMDTHTFLVEVTRQRIERYNTYIQFFESAVTSLQPLIDRLKSDFTGESLKNRQLQLYRSIINMYQRCLQLAHTHRQAAIDRLDMLTLF